MSKTKILLCLYLLFILIQSKMILQYNNNQRVDFPVVNCYRDLQYPSEQIDFNGTIVKGQLGNIVFYNISGFYFLQVDGDDFLYGEGYRVAIELQRGEDARGFFIKDNSKDPGREFVFPKDSRELRIPVGSIGRVDFLEVVEVFEDYSLEEFAAEVVFDKSTWEDLIPMLLVIHVVLVITSSVPLIVSSTNLIGFLRYDPMSTIAIVCLSFNVAQDILRAIGVFLDPFFFYPFDLFGISFIFPATASPFNIGTAILLICYWEETLRPTSLKVNSFLSVLFWPFVISVILIFFGSFIIIGLYIAKIDYILIVIGGTALINTIVVILYLILGKQVLDSIGKDLSSSTRIRSITINIIVAGIMILTSTVLDAIIVIFDTIETQDAPVWSTLILLIRQLQWQTISTTMSMIFSPRKRTSSSSLKRTPGSKSK